MSKSWLGPFVRVHKKLKITPSYLFDSLWPSADAVNWDVFTNNLEMLDGPHGETLWKVHLARKHGKQEIDTQEPTRGADEGGSESIDRLMVCEATRIIQRLAEKTKYP